ncbi:YgaP-like transmembrane domain [Rugamonas rubra]|uniref:YgaP-like transmembrane domain n=1 Tax=Rugamonas rubra TaxID=758825 RepID=UPI000B8229C8|nr:YgaP-like transmembrane domain [Rugamonas rubra]
MLNRKNVGSKERIARVIGGGLMIWCGLVPLHATALGLAIAGVGVVGMVTGAVRYCPACAIAGRKPIDND